MVLSPLQVEAYFEIAEKALDLCIVDEQSKPVIQNFRVELGRKINPAPSPDKLVLGALSVLLENDDFKVTELTPAKSFAYQPFFMRTKFEFIEGYVGNDTIRKWRKFDSIHHAVFACMRGTNGYPKGEAFQTVPEGLVVRPAIPGPVVNGVANTYGPMANFKIAVRELPDHGDFRVTVNAARYDDGLLLDPGTPANPDASRRAIVIEGLDKSPESTITIAEGGIYQVDVARDQETPRASCLCNSTTASLPVHCASTRSQHPTMPAEVVQGYLVVRLRPGAHRVVARLGNNATIRRLLFSRVDEQSTGAAVHGVRDARPMGRRACRPPS